MTTISSLPVAVRVYPQPNTSVSENPSEQRKKRWRRPDAMLVIDTETRIDTTQRLTFGSYRFIRDGMCQEEGPFYGSDLPEEDRKILESYASKHPADAVNRKLQLLTLPQFLPSFIRPYTKAAVFWLHLTFPSTCRESLGASRRREAVLLGVSLWNCGPALTIWAMKLKISIDRELE